MLDTTITSFLDHQDALPHLQKLLDDVHPYVQQAAQSAIEILQE